jgi:hypothetical protein
LDNNGGESLLKNGPIPEADLSEPGETAGKGTDK